MQEQLGQLKQLVEQQAQATKGNETAQGQKALHHVARNKFVLRVYVKQRPDIHCAH